MIDYSKLKLIIWDMDDTFWNGTLSEGDIELIPSHIQLIKDTTDCGIINTICSKNNEDDVKEVLKRHNLDGYFVFCSINWEPKGQRINTLLKDMSLRAPNALFFDDNVSNLNEALFYNKGLMIAGTSEISNLISYIANKQKNDTAHKRLDQYKLLEQKRKTAELFSTNEEFLKNCDIHIKFSTDCLPVAHRLYELVQRTNQLNFTKCRPSEGEFYKQLRQCDKCGYVEVQDRFGDYGIVGLYVLSNMKLVHFLFSCRTLGQGVEQYVYWKLGFPHLDVVGEVAVNLDKISKPEWIKEGNRIVKNVDEINITDRLLFKGPCDMSSMVGYLRLDDVFDVEFTFTNDDGQLIENHNHSSHIRGLKQYDIKTINKLKNDAFFFDDENYKSTIFSQNYKIIFLSTLIEGNYGMYRHKETGSIVAFGHYDKPLTDNSTWVGYINGSIINFGYKITEAILEDFSRKFEYVGRTTAEMYVSFINDLLNWLPEETHLCLILGSEIEYEQETLSTYKDRHMWHKSFNEELLKISNSRLHFINVTDYITSQNDFTNNINHFTPRVYYKLSSDIKALITEICKSTIVVRSNRLKFFIKQYLMPIVLLIIPRSIFDSIKRFLDNNILQNHDLNK